VLNERLKGFGPDDADHILSLTICEPAMGSAAFINEMCDQLAHEYLRLKQEQTGRIIEPGRYEDELRRTKHFIATRNVYGVDLNPTAVELGGLSLWLGSMHRLLVRKGEGPEPDRYRVGAVPWFGLRLRAGNSLIGARRAVWTSEQLRDGEHFGKYSSNPRPLRPGEARRENEIYHFLVWDEDMTPAFRDRLMRQFWPNECKSGDHWNSKQVKKKWSEADIAAGLAISSAIWVVAGLRPRSRLSAGAHSVRRQCLASARRWRRGTETWTDTGPAGRDTPDAGKKIGSLPALEAHHGRMVRLLFLADRECEGFAQPGGMAGCIKNLNRHRSRHS